MCEEHDRLEDEVMFSFSGEMDSEELALILEVGGRKGKAWLSEEMWLRMGEVAGWIKE